MKRLIRIGFVALLAAVSLSIIKPASAAIGITGCTQVTISGSGHGYPEANGQIYNCMPAPHNQNEQSMQSDIITKAWATVHVLTTDERNKLQAKNVQIYVFYNGTMALSQLGIVNAPAPGQNESGRTWADPSSQPNLPSPTSSIWVYTLNQWNAISGNPKIPTSYNLTQLNGTIHHELGHEMDRVWGQYRTPAITSITVSHTLWQRAIALDAQNISQSNLTKLQQEYPGEFNSNGSFNPSEVFAEEFAAYNGGGTQSDQDLQNIMSCSSWYVFTLKNNNGVAPSQLSAASCYGQTH